MIVLIEKKYYKTRFDMKKVSLLKTEYGTVNEL